jgi:folate-binding protein YgfZ
MRTAPKVIELEALGIVRMRGADAVKFLQGQLSNDVARLTAQRSLLAGYHNPQGRTIALLRLVQWDADDILAVVPRELTTVVAARLSKFVLRAKVKVVDESAGWRVLGLVGAASVAIAGGAPSVADADLRAPDGAGATSAGPAGTVGGLASAELPTAVGAQVRGDGDVFVCVSDQPLRWLVISPADAHSPVLDYPVGDHATWQRLEVAAGQPQVYAATSEEFVAQMLNLDTLNAIAFDKGCYTGQEVIARAHYRGRVKRRMQRFVSREACQLSPGDSGQLADGRTFKVVQAAQLADGRCDFLAVAPMVGAGSEATDATSKMASVASDAAPTAAGAAAAILLADQAPLPYPLPD